MSGAETPPVAEELPPLRLAEPLPGVVDDPGGYERVCAAVAEGVGPVALDAERASGYRYSQRAYLVQLRRAGAGTTLVDPIAFEDLSELDAAIGDAEWILHAATQDLPCLREVGLAPRALFDTELAGRLLNLPRVGLAGLVEQLLGRSLAKEHSAVDWSIRPLPEPWLEYAALDVEALVELRELLDAALVAAGKRGWAAQEFAWLLDFTGPRPRTDPWRRTSGIHKVRGRRPLGIVRELWYERDAIAAEIDRAPGKVLPDAAIVEIATARPATRAALRDLRSLRHRGARRHLDAWLGALHRALDMAESALPSPATRGDGPPPPRAWADKNPAAAARLAAAREAVGAIARHHDLPAENLLTPDTLRRLAWQPPDEPDPTTVRAALRALDARAWQIELTETALAEALAVEP